MREKIESLLKRAEVGGDPRGLPSVFTTLLRVPGDHLQYSPIQRATAIWVLARMDDVRAVPVLVKALSSRSVPVREVAARGLGELGMIERGVVSGLRRTLRADPKSAVRMAAAFALGLLGAAEALQPLLDVVASSQEDERVRGMAAEAIGDLSLPAAIEPLERVLSSGGAPATVVAEIRGTIERLQKAARP